MTPEEQEERFQALADEVECLASDAHGFDCGADDYSGPTDDTPWSEGDKCSLCAAFDAIDDLKSEVKTWSRAARYWEREAERLGAKV